MTNRELDTFIIGFAIGSIACLWLGYRLRVRVERWQSRRAERHRARVRGHDRLERRLGEPRQSVRSMLEKPRVIPLRSKRETPSVIDPDKVPIAPIPIAPGGTSEHARAVEDELRAEVIAALVGSGYKRFDAGTAVDACTFAERAGGLESWVAAAFRRAASK